MKHPDSRYPALTYALLYLRVSSLEQQREGISLDAQLAECRRYAAALGWVLAAEYTDILSGTRDDRPQYLALLADVRARRAAGQAVVVIVLRLDRLGRRLLERVRARDELKALGVPVHSVREGGEVSDLVSNILASVAQEEVRLLGERVADAKSHLARGGWWSGGRTPWGYRLRPATLPERAAGAPRNVLDLDADAVPFAREAVSRFLAGESVQSLARWVSTLPAAARGQRALRYANLRAWLRAPAPRGRISATSGVAGATSGVAGATFEVARWPALITPAQAVALDARMVQWAAGRRHATGRYLLTGWLRCPRCGATMAGHRYPPPRQARYDCMRVRLGRVELAPCHLSVSVPMLDTLVLDAVTARLAPALTHDPRLQRACARAWAQLAHADPAPAVQAQQQALERARAQAQRRLRDAATLYVDGGLDRAGYEAVRTEAEAALMAASVALEALPAPAPLQLPDWAAVRALGIDWPALAATRHPEPLRPILAELIEQVVPERQGHNRWGVQVTWTPLGDALGEVRG